MKIRLWKKLKALGRKQNEILLLLQGLATQGEKMSVELDTLSAQVAKNTTVEESAVALIQGLAQQIRDAGTDPVKLKALTDSLSGSATALAAAVAANTPAAPTPPATPVG